MPRGVFIMIFAGNLVTLHWLWKGGTAAVSTTWSAHQLCKQNTFTVNTQSEDGGKFFLWHIFHSAAEGALQKLHKWTPVRTENPSNLVVQSPCAKPGFLLITIPNGFIMVVLIQSWRNKEHLFWLGLSSWKCNRGMRTGKGTLKTKLAQFQNAKQ